MLQTEYHKVISHPNLKLQKSLASRKNEQPEGNVKYTVLKFYFCFFFFRYFISYVYLLYIWILLGIKSVSAVMQFDNYTACI